MYTHIHTTEWIHNPQTSSDKQNYFINRINGQILAELQTKGGFEYYLCTSVQMTNKTVGNYIGCIKTAKTDGKTANILVYNHDTQPEHTVSLNDEEYLL